MSFFHKKNVTKCLGHHYAIWTSDSNFSLSPKKKFLASLMLALISGTVSYDFSFGRIRQKKKIPVFLLTIPT